MTSYQYAGNSPVMMNDPMGDLTQSQWNDALTALGSSSSQSSHYDENGTSIMDELNGFYAAGDYNNFFGSWGTGGQLQVIFRRQPIIINLSMLLLHKP